MGLGVRDIRILVGLASTAFTRYRHAADLGKPKNEVSFFFTTLALNPNTSRTKPTALPFAFVIDSASILSAAIKCPELLWQPSQAAEQVPCPL